MSEPSAAEPTESEKALVVAIYRTTFEPVAKVFDETYEDIKGDELAKNCVEIVPLVRAHVEAETRQLRADLSAAREDSERLAFLIKQGPPGASEGNWLTDEAWELATMHAGDDDAKTDANAMRAAIDDARKTP